MKDIDNLKKKGCFIKKNSSKVLMNKKRKKVKNILYIFLNKGLYMLFGIFLTLFILFVLSGGKNYIKLYYELREFIEVYDILDSDYYGDIDKEKLVLNAIDSLLMINGDSYTTYVDKDSADNFLESINGTYEGIGCTVANDANGNIIVMEVFEDSPSYEAGLMKNDIILKIDDQDFVGKTSSEMSNYVTKSSLEKVKLNVKRGEQIFDITIKLKEISTPVISSKILEDSDKKVGYINIKVFSSGSYLQFKNKLKQLEKDNIGGLIVDVRGNSGGYLSAVTDLSSLFLKKGQVIYQLKDNNKIEKIQDSTKEYRKYPVVVLVNPASASASEIFAAAIKESYDGYVVGTNTYGKGTVQKTKLLSDGSMIKYTVQKWLTPNGNFVNKVGLTPTHIVELDYELGYDNQLKEALDIIIER